MTAGRVLMVLVYAAAYALAVYCGAVAVDAGQGLFALSLFITSAALLAAIRREFGAVARQLTASGRTVVVPAGCRCETWWTTLGYQHDGQCPTLSRKDTR
ncbi:hypothetical protein ACFWAP_03875 [Streptomyces goshikiensis]|uniref:hypothetical protein n=1 Tax=Streptomyces goshikiensis TaxID=1942 RepID=UPI0036665A44